MSIAFYLDENVPRSIRDGLRIRNIDVLTVQEDELTGFGDSVILERATELKRVLFSQDDDFLGEAIRRQQQGKYFSGVIYAHKLRVSLTLRAVNRRGF